MVHTWAKDCVKYDEHNVEPIHISGSGGTGKSHLVKDPSKPKVLLLGPTGISAVNNGGTTIHYGLAIKPGTKLLGSNNKSKAVLRNRFSEVKFR